jgi:PTS system ascorbate-specific IIA component
MLAITHFLTTSVLALTFATTITENSLENNLHCTPSTNKQEFLMLTQWLTPQHIRVVEHVSDWQEAVRLSAEPLLAEGAISPAYLDAIFTSHAELGPYYVLAPGLAMPHARPEQGANKNGLSLLHVKRGVRFAADENDPVYVVIMLCAVSGDDHIQMITALADVFSDESRLQQLLSASTLSAIEAVIQD